MCDVQELKSRVVRNNPDEEGAMKLPFLKMASNNILVAEVHSVVRNDIETVEVEYHSSYFSFS